MSAHTPRQIANMDAHFQLIDLAVVQFKKWPTVTSINNLRLRLDQLEIDIKAGHVAKVGAA